MHGLLAENAGDTHFLAPTGRCMLFAQAVAHSGQHWVMGHLGQVIYLDPVRMPFARSAQLRRQNLQSGDIEVPDVVHAGLVKMLNS